MNVAGLMHRVARDLDVSEALQRWTAEYAWDDDVLDAQWKTTAIAANASEAPPNLEPSS